MRALLIAILEKWACKHEWGEPTRYTRYWGTREEGEVHSYLLLFTCTKCGKPRREKIR